ncbi:MAG: MauE/DoxX family redox-associated membrane protein [Opitutales bacterium]
MEKRLATVGSWLPPVVLAAVFLWAAFGKLADPSDLLEAILGYQLVPRPWAYLGAYLLPSLELSAALALLLPGWRRAGALWIAALLVVFCGALIAAWVRGIDLACGCFGGGDSPTEYPLALLRNAALLALAAWMAWRPRLFRPSRSDGPALSAG